MATAEIKERTALILSRIPQKERDAMVKAIDGEGIFSFYARGALKMGGVTNFATQELAISALNLTISGSGAITLKEGRISRLYAPKGGLEGLLVAQLILEFAAKALIEEEAGTFYPTILNALQALEDDADPYSVAVMFLAKGMIALGLGLEVGHCVGCGATKDIVAVDFVQGGFLCQDCLGLSTRGLSDLDELKIYRHAFRCPETDFVRVNYPGLSKMRVLMDLLTHLSDGTGVKLRSLDAILRPR